jgi:hypothetical protein
MGKSRSIIMAVYRQIQTSFWQDDFVLQLTPEEKYFYFYLLTNSKTKQCGIYQLPMPVIIIETGYNQETIEKLLDRYVEYGKIIYSARTREIGIVNWLKYNPMESPKTKACVLKELKEVKDKSLIGRIYTKYPLEGVSQEEEEKEEEQTKEEVEEEPAAASSSSEEILGKGNINMENTTSGVNTDGGELSHCDSLRLRTSANGIRNDPDGTGTGANPHITNGEDDDYGDYQCMGIQNQAKKLLSRIWNKNNPNPEECRIAAEYIVSYGLREVEVVLSEAVKYGKKSLAYVETVLKKRKERGEIIKKAEEEKRKRHEAMLKAEEQRKSGVKLHLVRDAFGE